MNKIFERKYRSFKFLAKLNEKRLRTISFNISSITCLFKNNGYRADAKNYTGISIMATCCKILSAIIINRIRICYEKLISNSQFGFRSNKSTSDAIFVLRKTVEINSCEFYCCFIDIKASYDWINRDCYSMSSKYDFNLPVIVKILRMLYKWRVWSCCYWIRVFVRSLGIIPKKINGRTTTLYLNLSGHDIFKKRFGTSLEKHCLTAMPYRLFQGNLRN